MLTRIMEDAEIEESFAEMDLKRKAEEQTSQEGRKPKKRRMERLEGWGIGTSQGEPLDAAEPIKMKVWEMSTMIQVKASRPQSRTGRRRLETIVFQRAGMR